MVSTLARFSVRGASLFEWADGARALHGEVLASTSFAGSHAARGTVGFTGKF
jgi:hypothetical protein